MFLPRYLSTMLLFATTGPAAVADDLPGGAAPSPTTELFAEADAPLLPLDPQWYATTRDALAAEAERVSQAWETAGPDVADAWKRHLHWESLEQHLQKPLPGDLDQLALVRRWLYSNKPGLEDEPFAELRRLADAHLDAVIAFSADDLHAEVRRRAAEAALLCQRLTVAPNEDDAAQLGRLLGWLDRVGQRSADVAYARNAFSHPNVELLVADRLIQRIMQSQTGPIDETVDLNDCTVAPATNRFQRERPVQVTGHARTEGRVALQLAADPTRAKFVIVYEGTLHAECRADAGPAAMHLRAGGDAAATQPVYFDRDGLTSGQIDVTPNVSSHLVGISARSRLLRQIAERRALHPTSRAKQQQEATRTAVEQLERKLDEQVTDALEKIRSEAQAMRESLAGLGEATAPLRREGALPKFVGASTTDAALALHVLAGNRDQLGAARRPPEKSDADLTVRVHVSAFNNMAETITGGKRLNDQFFMRYGKIVHAELPVPLMVHSRARRWAVAASPHRPMELRIPEPDLLELVLRLEGVEIDEQTYRQPATLRFRYQLISDALGEIALVRVGEPRLASELPESVQDLLLEKFGAFFGPTLTGGGVIVPSGGPLGLLSQLQLEKVAAAEEWIVVDLNASASLVDEFNRWRENGDGRAEAESARLQASDASLGGQVE